MAKTINITGQRFGHILIIGQATNVTSRAGEQVTQWHCLCDCGKGFIVGKQKIKRSKTKACKGCPLIPRKLPVDQFERNLNGFLDRSKPIKKSVER